MNRLQLILLDYDPDAKVAAAAAALPEPKDHKWERATGGVAQAGELFS